MEHGHTTTVPQLDYRITEHGSAAVVLQVLSAIYTIMARYYE